MFNKQRTIKPAISKQSTACPTHHLHKHIEHNEHHTRLLSRATTVAALCKKNTTKQLHSVFHCDCSHCICLPHVCLHSASQVSSLKSQVSSLKLNNTSMSKSIISCIINQMLHHTGHRKLEHITWNIINASAIYITHASSMGRHRHQNFSATLSNN